MAAVRKVNQGARHPRRAEQIFSGWAPGGEAGWGGYSSIRVTGSSGVPAIASVQESQLDARRLRLGEGRCGRRQRHSLLRRDSRDYRAFKARGGKLIMCTGLADPVVPLGDTIGYYQDVVNATGGMAQTQSFFRFFPVPGMGHCSGGPGPSSFDALAALEQWHEKGIAPAHLLGRHLTNGAVDRTRPLCAFPSVPASMEWEARTRPSASHAWRGRPAARRQERTGASRFREIVSVASTFVPVRWFVHD